MKQDKFALEVEHTFTFFEEHQKDITRYGAVVVVVVVLIAGYVMYSRKQHSEREQALAAAIRVQEAPVSPTPDTRGGLTFTTEEAKNQAASKAFTDLTTKYSGSAEAEIGQYYLGSIKADQGKLADAEKTFLEVSQKGDEKYASLAKLSLAQIYFSDGRTAQGEKILRDLMASPTVFVSKEQATITLARYYMTKNPAEARKLLEPLRTIPGEAGQVALSMIGELPPQ
ncbi:MAG TPA: tetratricopeptide repeat protein [Bryobacteraceae bacterium]|nr:tetratricopeptide repeat protein [Bryobacteraceae bacterium]